jgi:hypothetical protein
MGVNLHIHIGKRQFDLGRSYNYIDCMESSLDTNLESLYNKRQYVTDEITKQIIAMAAHHPTKEELQELYDEITDMVAGYADDMERIGRCLTLAEIKDNDHDIIFEVR